jgi:hypothetical protein
MKKKIYLDENGITIRCTPDCPVGYKEFVNGIEYEVADRELVITRIRKFSDASNLCVSLITDMSYLFQYEPFFNDRIDNWDVSNVTNMKGMFYWTIFNQPIGNWDVSKVTNMEGMFYSSDFNKDICNWNVSKVKNMAAMFCNSKFNKSICNWDISGAETYEGIF